MATAAFRSTSRRTSIGDSSSTNRNPSHHRRSRSVSRFSHRIPADDTVEQSSTVRRGKFVNTVRGSGVPEISLDDLAIELFSSSDFGDKNRELSETSTGNDTTAFHRRGRSVSRRESSVGEQRELSGKNDNYGGNQVYDGSSRRRRSLSVISRRINDSENERYHRNRSSANFRDVGVWHKEKPLPQKPTSSYQQRGLRRSTSQKDFFRSHDGYSSHASTLTDDEGNGVLYNTNGVVKGMQAAYEQTKLMTDNCHSQRSAQSHGLKPVSTTRRTYKTKSEQSEKRKQELLAEMMLVEKRGKELKKIVGEFCTTSKDTAAATRKPTRGRKRSNDRNRMSGQLVEEADKIIEDFISSVEETDISSFDGERSDTSSIMGGAVRSMMQYGDIETFRSPLRSDLLPGEMDGVVLPWLKWETSNDITPLLRSDNKQIPATPKTVLQDAVKDANAVPEQEVSVNSKSSRGSWSPIVVNSFSLEDREMNKEGDVGSCKDHLLSLVPRRSQVDIDEYLNTQSNENLLSERWKQRERLNSGGLLICNSGFLGKFFF